MTPIPLADTSIFIAVEQRRRMRETPPREYRVSAVTIGELRLGVYVAKDATIHAKRLRTLTMALAAEPLPVNDAVADAWAELTAILREQGRKMPVNDSWIAATAIANGLPLATQDRDYDDLPGLTVIKL
jgi:predicted nucleic acid-binding protein